MDVNLIAVSLLWKELRKLGGLGLVLLGIADASLIPLPGSIDALTIFLSARHPLVWPFYALSATVGSVLGGYLTYRIGRRGGERALEGRLSKKQIKKVFKSYQRWGFGSIFVPAMLPPPVPFTPFVIMAGAMGCSRSKFLSALISGRALRFAAVAYLSAHYHRRLVSWIAQYHQPILVGVVAFTAALVILGIFLYLRHRQTRHRVEQVRIPEG